MLLGTFTKHEDGTISGTATTLFGSFDLVYRPVEEKVGNSADFRIYRKDSDIEVGFARYSVGEVSRKEYLNSLIDSPELPTGIWAALVKEENGSYVLKWSRPNRRKKADVQSDPGQSEAVAKF